MTNFEASLRVLLLAGIAVAGMLLAGFLFLRSWVTFQAVAADTNPDALFPTGVPVAAPFATPWFGTMVPFQTWDGSLFAPAATPIPSGGAFIVASTR